MGILHEDQDTFFKLFHSVFLRMRNVSDKCFRENQNTPFVFNNLLNWESAIYEKMWKNIVEPNRHHITISGKKDHCVLESQVYRHTLRICNTYCFFSATVVAWIWLSVVLYVCCPSCKHV